MDEAIGTFLVGFIGILVLLFTVSGIRKLADWVISSFAICKPLISSVLNPVHVRSSRHYNTPNSSPSIHFQSHVSPAKQPIKNVNNGHIINNQVPTQTYMSSPNTGWIQKTLYHGTPKGENLKDIKAAGFIIGPGNANGTGLYMADLATAQGFANPNGIILVLLLSCPSNQIADYQSVINSDMYKTWIFFSGSGNPGDDVTNYCLNVIKKRFLNNSPTYVALSPKTTNNERVQFQGITITGCLDSKGKPLS